MAAREDGFKYSGAAPASDPAWRVVISPGPSRRVRWWIAVIGVLALAATLSAPIPTLAQAAVALVLSCEAFRAARRLGWRRGGGAVHHCRVEPGGRVEVEFSGGRRVAGRLLDGSFVAPWLALVRWLPEGALFARTILVAPDAVDAEAFRRLRIVLRWR